MANPLTWPTTHDQVDCKGQPIAAKAPLQGGGRLRPGPLQRAAASRGSSPQGAATRGHGRLRPALPLVRVTTPTARVATPW
ncbi:hypothetical protein B296_00019506 [Ensete ventricosum]|uniref:Uncharacterized protein n=1 Tax=Ensete ventricosum TaxID=4639 RepID=A0A426YW23_ENSVE|nr:hypothetical protein B296_00019506 [Ensete ventricosum]